MANDSFYINGRATSIFHHLECIYIACYKQGREEKKKKKKKMTDYAILGVDYITRSSTTPGSPLLVFFHFFIIA